MDGPGGIAVDAFADTFPDGAVVTIKPVTEAEFPSNSRRTRPIFSYTAGFTLDFGGATPKRYLNVSVPAGSGDKADDQWFISQIIKVDGSPCSTRSTRRNSSAGASRRRRHRARGARGGDVRRPQVGEDDGGRLWHRRDTADSRHVPRDRVAVARGRRQQRGRFDGGARGAYFDNTFNFCLPIMTSRITLTRNTVDILVPVDRIAPMSCRFRSAIPAPTATTAGDSRGTSST